MKDDLITFPPIPKDILNCIRHPSISWRANPKDPFIYVSFSHNQLMSAYSDDFGYFFNWSKENEGQSDFDKDQIRELKKFLHREWIGRAKFPMKFLDANASADEIKMKNVVFIFTNDVDRSGATSKFFSENAPFKIINISKNLPDFGGSHIDSYKHVLLHETGHAFIELKHNKPKDPSDHAPFCEMPCTASVIVYTDDCSQIELAAALAEIPKEQRNSNELIRKIRVMELTPIDIQAAQDFLKDWLQKSEGAFHYLPSALEIESKLKKLAILQDKMSSLSRNWFYRAYQSISNTFDGACDSFAKYLRSVVDECPSYFGPNDITSVRNQDMLHLKAALDDNEQNYRFLSNNPAGLFHLPANMTLPAPSSHLRLGRS